MDGRGVCDLWAMHYAGVHRTMRNRTAWFVDGRVEGYYHRSSDSVVWLSGAANVIASTTL